MGIPRGAVERSYRVHRPGHSVILPLRPLEAWSWWWSNTPSHGDATYITPDGPLFGRAAIQKLYEEELKSATPEPAKLVG